MLHRFILHNGEVHDASEKTLSPGQIGLLSGWGIFSTLRVAEGVLFAWERHWARMSRDAAALHVPMPEDSEQMRRDLLRLVEANRAFNATLRVVVVRNRGGVWEGPGSGRPADIIALTTDTKNWGSGVRLRPVPQARHAACMFAGTKSLSWSMNLTWLEEAQAAGFDEALLLNERGQVSECTSANIFMAVGNQVSTPPLNSGCLPGITRELLLSEVRASGFAVCEKEITFEELEAADDVFITSTTRDLLPVAEIEGRKIAARGKARAALQEAFSAYVRRYVGEHKA